MMAYEQWIEQFDPMEMDDPKIGFAARSLRDYMLGRFGQPFGSIQEIRRSDRCALVILHLNTKAPQRPAVDIRSWERVAVLLPDGDCAPSAFALREDFPSTEHQNPVPPGIPKHLCIDGRDWLEARLNWSSSELIERIINWFRQIAMGELHAINQPLDPQFFSNGHWVLIPQALLKCKAEQKLQAIMDEAHPMCLRIRSEKPEEEGVDNFPVTMFQYQMPPRQMSPFRKPPANLAHLHKWMAASGFELFPMVTNKLLSWLANDSPTNCQHLNSKLLFVIEIPMKSMRDDSEIGLDHRAFLSTEVAGDIACRIGIARCKAEQDGSRQYLVDPDFAHCGEEITLTVQLEPAEVHLEFDRERAARVTGHTTTDARKVTIIGAGAIGSHVADNLAREGQFSWTVIDDDYLLPHNLARHVLLSPMVGQPKAQCLASHIDALFPGTEPTTAVNEMYRTNRNLMEQHNVAPAITGADIVIDASASIDVPKYLSDIDIDGRKASAFLNPRGTAAVLLVEPTNGPQTLRELEAQYLALVLNSSKERLQQHLTFDGEVALYSGACRAVTNQIPKTNVAILSGLVAKSLHANLQHDSGCIKIWTLGDSGEVMVDSPELVRVQEFQFGDWRVMLDHGTIQFLRSQRSAHLPCETGGTLFGVANRPQKVVSLVRASPAPPDSKESPCGFERGVCGVDEEIDLVHDRTRGQVRYVGEWHSHPKYSNSQPSDTDLEQISVLAEWLEADSMRALMIIVGEKEISVSLGDEPCQTLCLSDFSG